MALYLFVVLVPAIQGAGFSLTNWDGLSAVKHFVGLANFGAIAHDPDAVAAIRQTIMFTIAVVVGQSILGLLLALGVRSKIKIRGPLRVLLFAPAVVAPMMTAYLWQYILSPQGALNAAFGDLGLASLEKDWLGDPQLALWSIAAVTIWQFSGYSMVIFLAGLEGIPADVLEAADVDGAGVLSKFFHVILPLLRPAVVVNFMITIISGLKQFDTVWIMTQGGPGNSTQTLSTLIYRDAFTLGTFGYSIALAVVLTAIVVVVSIAQYTLLNRRRRLQ